MHRRAEVLIGVLPEWRFGVATAAMLMLFDFFLGALKLNKLYAFVHADNRHSLDGSLHLGFREEGYLRQHVRDPVSGEYYDLIQMGITEIEALSEPNARLTRPTSTYG